MLEEVAMKIFHILCFFILILATYINTITSSSCDGHNVTHVAMNPTLFPCPVPDSDISCKSVTMNDLISTRITAIHNRIPCSNEVVFQQGSYEVKKINSRFSRLLLLASEDLVIQGQDDVTIICIDDSTIILSTASNIKIRKLKFQACSISLAASKRSLSSIFITNSIFNASRLSLVGSDSDTLLATLQTIELITTSLTLKKANHVHITGKSSAIICTTDSNFILKSKAHGTVNLTDIKFQDCSNILIKSRSNIVTFETNNNTWFNNSCLIFESTRTRSSTHNLSIAMTKTNVERCSCKFLQLHANFSIAISILLHEMTVTGNDLPFIEFKNMHNVSVTIMGLCVFRKNKNFVLHLVGGSIHFVRARVNFTNCTTVQSAPIYTQGSTIEFEDSTVMFYHGIIKVLSLVELLQMQPRLILRTMFLLCFITTVV